MHALLLALAPALPSGDGWVPLPVPSLCRTHGRADLPPVLASGSHVEIARADEGDAGEPPAPPLAWTTLLQIVEEDARARGARLEVARYEGGALVRGDTAAALAIAEAFESAGRALEIDLDVRFVPASGEAGAERFRTRARSGDTVFVGARETRTYVGSYEVQVAAESGQSEPVIGRAHFGRGMHLTVARVLGGERVYVEGVFDAAELVDVHEFDPGTADLGLVEEPEVAWTQAWFAGTVTAQGMLALEVSGPGGRGSSVRIEIQARAQGEAALDAAAGTASSHLVVDLAFASAPRAPTSTLAQDGERAGFVPPGPIPASAIASLVESARGPTPRGGRPPLHWSETLLLVPRADAAALAEARALVKALEEARLPEVAVEVRHGALTALLPVCAGAPARAALGVERPLLVEYRLEVAPQIWMPRPVVETHFGGSRFDLAFAGARLEARLEASVLGPIVERSREAAQVGRLQAAARNVRRSRASVEPGSSATLDLTGLPSGAGNVKCTSK